MREVIAFLREHGIQPTPQRLAVAEYVLKTEDHPSADEVWVQVQRRCPTLSRATVYNTLNLFARKGLLKLQNVRDNAVAFDPNTERHHHFIDEDTGKVYDIPWETLAVSGEGNLKGYDVHDYQVILRGRRRKR